jgi:subtilisin family serine protease
VKNILTFLLLALLSSTAFSQAEVSTRLTNALRNSGPNEYLKVFVYLEDQVDIEALNRKLYAENASLERRAYEVITALQQKAEVSQPALLQFMQQNYSEAAVFSYESYWIANMILVEAKPDIIHQLAARMDVAQMDLDAVLELDRPVNEEYVESIESVEAGVKIINAHKLWEIGITGQGRLIMGIDTGVDINHPALGFKWRGNTVPNNHAWFDPNTNSQTPTDCDGHGTHTMGTMAGWSPTTGDTVGVAINAEWIAAKTICSSPHTSNSIAAFQWAINPDGNPSTITDMPDAITNSWWDPSTTNECAGIYKSTLDAVEAAGIAVVFSAGNSGPGASTITKPKNLSTDEVNIFCVANIQGAQYLSGNMNPIANSSSRGPSLCGGTGSLLFKPEVAAPGTSVRSSVPGGGYGLKTGTSMAAPHVAGAITLLRQAFPTITGWEAKLALYNTAIDLGTAGEDNTYGKGLIDVYAAYNMLLPVELSSFTGIAKMNEVVLNWSTVTEINNSGFHVERRTENESWSTTGFINGHGNSTEVNHYTFTDKGLNPEKYYYRLKQVDYDGSFEYSGEVEVVVGSPVEFSLMQNYPNPFNPMTTIEFSIPEKADISIMIYSALGELVSTLTSGSYNAGYHKLNFDASSLPSGMYMYQLNASAEGKVYSSTKKMSLVK